MCVSFILSSFLSFFGFSLFVRLFFSVFLSFHSFLSQSFLSQSSFLSLFVIFPFSFFLSFSLSLVLFLSMKWHFMYVWKTTERFYVINTECFYSFLYERVWIYTKCNGPKCETVRTLYTVRCEKKMFVSLHKISIQNKTFIFIVHFGEFTKCMSVAHIQITFFWNTNVFYFLTRKCFTINNFFHVILRKYFFEEKTKFVLRQLITWCNLCSFSFSNAFFLLETFSILYSTSRTFFFYFPNVFFSHQTFFIHQKKFHALKLFYAS